MSTVGSFIKVSTLTVAVCMALLALWLGYELRDPLHAVPPSYLVHSCSSNPLPKAQQELAHPDIPYRCGVTELFSSPNVTVEAFVQPDGGPSWSNAGRIKADGHVYQVDALVDQNLAGAMDEASELGAADTFILTHPHGDHIGGISAFQNITRGVMQETMLPVVEGILKSSRGQAKKQAMAYYLYEWVGQYLQGYLNLLPASLQHFVTKVERGHYAAKFDPAKPETLPFAVEAFNGDNLKVGEHIEIKCFGPTHSAYDCMVIVPEAKVVFTGDLLFVGVAPIMTTGSAQHWLNALIWLERSIDSSWKLVPGHGPVTTFEGLEAVKHYLRDLQTSVRQEGCSCLESGGFCGTDFYKELPEEFSDWAEPQRSVMDAHIECEWTKGRRPDQSNLADLFVDSELLKLKSSN
ncbi:hypothetical protein FOL47_001986 [Perkinsus chesapeaki]|uniref:Metallo-beta-lactamase domain-containing protein n=1 Tax=Perkinsus chesapeaki TaxID=330153 RepID=A0A7J6MFY7_PERCH|nr:hypothetical protein FOL47_001986 [Perkinsus chesapeaki]